MLLADIIFDRLPLKNAKRITDSIKHIPVNFEWMPVLWLNPFKYLNQ